MKKYLNYYRFSRVAETTLMSLTAAHAPFVNGGKKVEPSLISRIQDRRGKTIFKVKIENVFGCDKFIDQSSELPRIQNTNIQVLSKTVYQMTSILAGAVERGTAKTKNA